MLTGRRNAAALLTTGVALLMGGEAAIASGTGTPPNFGPYSWVEGSKIGVLTDNPESYAAIFVNSINPDTTPPAGEWIALKLAQFGIPADAKAVFIGGILIITHGRKTQLCNLTVTFAKPGSTSATGNYIFQAAEGQTEGGQRSTAGTWVPVVDGVTLWQWARGDVKTQYPKGAIGPYPAECSYGINLSVQAYIR
jgi:hypothetical protein